MIVLRRHGEATEWELGYLEAVCRALFFFKTIRKEQRKIPAIGPDAHIHWHIEKPWQFIG